MRTVIAIAFSYLFFHEIAQVEERLKKLPAQLTLVEENRGLSPTIHGGDSPARFLASSKIHWIFGNLKTLFSCNSRGHSSPHLKEGDFCHSNLINDRSNLIPRR